MSLESKAFWIKVPIIGGNPNVQVVTLDEAQKLETDLRKGNSTLLVAFNYQADTIEGLQSKIAEANKILDEIRELIMNAPIPSDEALEEIYKKVNAIQLCFSQGENKTK